MKSRILYAVTGLLLFVGLSATSVFAQDPEAAEVPVGQTPEISFGIAGGPTVPQADLNNAVDTGFHIMGLADGIFPAFPLGMRADISYAQMPDQLGGDYRQYSGTINARVEIPDLPAAPYLIGGVGIYGDEFTETHLETEEEFVHRSTDLRAHAGVSGGIGVRLGQLGAVNAFVETRYHNVFADNYSNQFVPITIGVMF